MTRAQVQQHIVGSADYVIAHAKRQQSRGKGPSVSFMGQSNPRRALAVAKAVVALVGRRKNVRIDSGTDDGLLEDYPEIRPDGYRLTMSRTMRDKLTAGLVAKMSDRPIAPVALPEYYKVAMGQFDPGRLTRLAFKLSESPDKASGRPL